MKELEFKSPQEFILWLMDNEGKEICDCYGRKWKYEDYSFFFKDICKTDVYFRGVECLHLFKTTLISQKIQQP